MSKQSDVDALGPYAWVRMTALTSAGGAHWAPNGSAVSRVAPLGLARVAIYATTDEARARAVAALARTYTSNLSALE